MSDISRRLPESHSVICALKGVTEHAHFLKELPDAQRIRHAISDCFESAVVPTYVLFFLHIYMMKMDLI